MYQYGKGGLATRQCVGQLQETYAMWYTSVTKAAVRPVKICGYTVTVATN